MNRFVQRNGIQVEVSNTDPCTGSGDYTQQLRVLATPELNGTAVQCAAVAIRSAADGVFFSRYAVLMVEPIGESIISFHHNLTIDSEGLLYAT